jgi:hypothetical protein
MTPLHKHQSNGHQSNGHQSNGHNSMKATFKLFLYHYNNNKDIIKVLKYIFCKSGSVFTCAGSILE